MTNKFLDKQRFISYQPKQPLATVNVDEDYKSPKKRRHEPDDLNLTEDEMSVNTINRYTAPYRLTSQKFFVPT